MDEQAVRKLDIQTLLKRKKVETTEEVVLTPAPNTTSSRSLSSGSPVIEAEVEAIDDMTKEFGNPHLPKKLEKSDLQERTVSEILDKYNKKYNLDLHYGNFQDALNLAVEGDKVKGDLMNAVVGNSILSLVDFTNFTLIILACKQIQGVVTELLEGDQLGDEERLVLIDRIFLWINRLQGVKSLYSQTDIDHIIKKLEQNKLRSGNQGTSVAINKILDILKLGKKD